jgi:magnesium-transporting ATPase (P-type)
MKKSQRVKTDVLRMGILFFSFCTICLNIEDGGFYYWKGGTSVGYVALPIFYEVIGYVSLFLTVFLVAAAFNNWLCEKFHLKEIMSDNDVKSRWNLISSARYCMWMIIFVVLFAGLVNFMSNASSQSLAANAAVWIGIILCFIVLGILLMKSPKQRSRKDSLERSFWNAAMYPDFYDSSEIK